MNYRSHKSEARIKNILHRRGAKYAKEKQENSRGQIYTFDKNTKAGVRR